MLYSKMWRVSARLTPSLSLQIFELLSARKADAAAEAAKAAAARANGASGGYSSEVRVSMLEIYMEELRDLLVPDGRSLEVRRSRDGVSQEVPGLTTESVSSLAEFGKVFKRGHTVRRAFPRFARARAPLSRPGPPSTTRRRLE